jgi:hypothetical protein
MSDIVSSRGASPSPWWIDCGGDCASVCRSSLLRLLLHEECLSFLLTKDFTLVCSTIVCKIILWSKRAIYEEFGAIDEECEILFCVWRFWECVSPLSTWRNQIISLDESQPLTSRLRCQNLTLLLLRTPASHRWTPPPPHQKPRHTIGS